MNNFLSPAMNRHLKGLLLLVLLFSTEFVRHYEHCGLGLFDLISGDTSALFVDQGDGCEGENGSAPFPDTSGDDDGGFQTPLQLDLITDPNCPFFSRLIFSVYSAAVESSEHRQLGRNTIPLFILHGTFRGALPA